MIEQLLLTFEHLLNASPIIGIGVSFLAGILSSLSPCVYPLIPITLGVVGTAAVNSRSRGFLLSGVFTLGVATTYTILGIAAALFGVLLSKFFINPVTFLALALLFIFLGLVMLNVIRLDLAFFGGLHHHKGGMITVFALGLVSSLGLIPCNVPILGAILGIIALKKNILYGAAALFAFSLGYGFILMLLGTFSSLIRRLPKHGLWLTMIRNLMGALLITIGGYFILKFIRTLQ
ncbi:MAG: cytochrome c biogenesis protein CcdA [Candidatus Omnitrophota bacterium]